MCTVNNQRRGEDRRRLVRPLIVQLNPIGKEKLYINQKSFL